ncbi:granulocyte-macrophage colony-stimulating factor receptor subunit alpha isoform X2 [Alligator mississippiensis]|nr:granulocyte-macrophage colony-stimulating factor receptor subunit alpha isoform X2 [Alligator mississippiensis]
MVITLGVSAMIWCILPFHPVHATIQCTHSNETTSPITNLTVNLKKLELTWDSSLNFTKYQCTLKTKNSSVEKKENKKNCIFSRKPIHEGAIFRVEGNYDMVSYSSECTFIPEGLSGTSVENFACVIYNVSFMNCTWTPGRNTPEDTQYFLYQKFSKEGERQCQHYIKDAHGRHTGCRFQDVVIKDNNVVYFLVNGSSKESKIQFYDEYITLYEIELLTTPTNITVNCEEPPRCIVEWEPPRRSQRKGNQCFQYNIDIQRKTAMADPAERRDDSPTIVNENTYRFENFNAKKKHFLKIRARGYNCPISENWGEWSETIEFDVTGPTGGIGHHEAAHQLGIAAGDAASMQDARCWVPGSKRSHDERVDRHVIAVAPQDVGQQGILLPLASVKAWRRFSKGMVTSMITTFLASLLAMMMSGRIWLSQPRTVRFMETSPTAAGMALTRWSGQRCNGAARLWGAARSCTARGGRSLLCSRTIGISCPTGQSGQPHSEAGS